MKYNYYKLVSCTAGESQTSCEGSAEVLHLWWSKDIREGRFIERERPFVRQAERVGTSNSFQTNGPFTRKKQSSSKPQETHL